MSSEQPTCRWRQRKRDQPLHLQRARHHEQNHHRRYSTTKRHQNTTIGWACWARSVLSMLGGSRLTFRTGRICTMLSGAQEFHNTEVGSKGYTQMLAAQGKGKAKGTRHRSDRPACRAICPSCVLVAAHAFTNVSDIVADGNQDPLITAPRTHCTVSPCL